MKFLKPYVLYSHKKKKDRRRNERLDSETTNNAPEEALLDFKPDDNEIDGKLYDGIVEDKIRSSKQVETYSHENRNDL